MDGLEATRRWRQIEAQQQQQANEDSSHHHHQVIIGMSANSDHDTMEEAFVAGVDDFMKKPFTLAHFQTTVSRILSPPSPHHNNHHHHHNH